MEFDGAGLAEEMFRAYLEQILVHGFFHADPHPGNVFMTDDHRIALIDLGMVGRITPRLQEELLQLLLAIAEGRGEEAADIAIKIGEPKADFDRKEFTRTHFRNRRAAENDHGRTDGGRPPRARSHANIGAKRHSRAARADDAGKNVAQSRPGRARTRAGV